MYYEDSMYYEDTIEIDGMSFAVLQVRLLDEFGDVIAKSSYLGGVESDDWQFCAEELTRELIADLETMAA